MAVTQDSFTGNGTKTDYDFTFPYLKQSEVKASLDGTATTNFRFLTATKIQFVNNTTANTPTAPASGVKIKIFRETDTSSLAATFYAGSAIKSEDLNDNFTQNIYATQEVSERYLSNLGGTMVGDLQLGEDVIIKWEGATDNDFETTLTVADPTADRTITLPDETGTVITSAGTDVIDSAHYVAGSIDNEHLAANSVDSDQYVDGSIDLIHMSANSVDSDQYVDGSIDHVHLSNDCIDGDNIQDDVINSEHIAAGAVDLEHMSANSVDSDQYVDGSIDSAHIGNDQIDSQHYAAGSIDLEHMSANSVDSDQYVDGSIDLVHMSANSVDSDQYVDGSIDHVHLSNDCIDGDNIQDDVINSEHIAAGAVDLEHMSANSVDSDQYVDGSIDRVHLSADIIDATKIEDDAVTTDHIQDAELVTLAGMPSNTASVLADSTALTATTAELNILDNKSFRASGDGALTTTSDTEIPSSKVVANHVAAQLGTVGGFTTIATEVAFPATASQPAAGVIISISDAAGVVVNGSGVSTTGRSTDGTPATVTINSFPSSLNGETLASGVGLLVTSTGSGNTYTYHKLLAAESDVKQLSDDINDFNARYRVASSAPGSNNDAGDMYFDTTANKMKVYNGTTNAWDDVASVGNFYINTISSSSGTGGGSATFNGSAYRFTLSNPPTMAQQLVVSVNGVIQKPNAGSSQPSEGFAISGNDIIFSAAPASGADYFIITQGSSVSIGTPSDNTVSTAKIQNLAVNNDKIANDTIAEVKLDIHNAPATDKYLKYTSNGMEWADGASEGTDVKSTGESGTTKFLRVDGDGTSSWQVPPDTVYTHPNHSGEVTSSADGAQTIASNVVDEDNLKISNAGSDGQYLQKQSGNTGGLTWATVDLTNLNASNLTSGTIPNARFPSVLPAISGVNLTNLPPSGGSFTATASGSITAGKPVVVNTSGQVEQVVRNVTHKSTPDTETLGTTNRWYPYNYNSGERNNGSQYHTRMIWVEEKQKLVMVWEKYRSGQTSSYNQSYINSATIGTDGTATWDLNGGTGTTNTTAIGNTGSWNRRPFLAYDATADRIVVAYGRGNQREPYTVVLTPDWTGGTWPSSGGLEQGSSIGNYAIIGFEHDKQHNKFVIYYRGPSDHLYCKVGEMNANKNGITWGSAVQLTNFYCGYFAWLWHPRDGSNGRHYCFVGTNGSGYPLKYIVHNVSSSSNTTTVQNSTSGTTISSSGYWHVNGGKGCSADEWTDGTNYKIGLTIGQQQNGEQQRLIIGTANTTSISFGSSIQTYNQSSSTGMNDTYFQYVQYHGCYWDSIAEKLVTYKSRKNNSTSHYVDYQMWSISGNTPSKFNNNAAKYIGGNAGPASNIAQALYIQSKNWGIQAGMATDSGHNLWFGHSIQNSSFTTNLNANNFAGISSANYSNGSTATIHVVGKVNENQSGLAAGSKYYVIDNGTLSTTAGNPSVDAGLALSSTKLLIK